MPIDTHTFPALGTEAVVAVSDADALPAAVATSRAEVAACDAACSRFRDDSDLSRLNAGAGRYVDVSLRLIDDLEAALWAAHLTDGLIDPSVGQALIDLGYDRDFDALPMTGSSGPTMITFAAVPGWTTISVDRANRRARIPAGVRVDLGSTAKARSADLAARAAAEATGASVLVSLGGDVSVAGPAPAEGWSIWVTDSARNPFDAPGQMVAIETGGLATSGTAARSWRRGGRDLHHLIDPRTGRPAPVVWRTVTVAAASCLDANVASTASVILGARAPEWLSSHGLAARLVRADGDVVRVGGWPSDVTPVPAAQAA